MHPARGSKMATETARSACGAGAADLRATRRRTGRLLLAGAMACALAAWAAGSALGLGGGAGAGLRSTTHETALAPAAATHPLILAKGARAKRRSGAASIGLFTAIPATVPASGGRVHLLAVVQSARSCRFTSSKPLKRLPASERCSAGKASFEVTLPRNGTSDRRTYRFDLVASGLHGTARTAPVTVVERAPPVPAVAPSITAEPVNRSVTAGSNVTFTAGASGAASVQWEFSADGGQSWSNVAGASDDTYSFVATTGESGYEYRAVFSNHGRSTATAAVTLTVSPAAGLPVAQQGGQGAVSAGVSDLAPVITLQPAGDGVASGDTAMFTASASGAPSPTVQWQVSTDGTTWSNVPGATSNTYSFPVTLADNGQEYRAVFTNSAGSATTNAVLLDVVHYAIPPTVDTQPLSQTVIAGASVTFTSTASGGVPAPTVEWEMSADGGTTWSPISAATSASYTFTALPSDNGNQYRAEFSSDTASVYSQAATLTVSEPVAPVITTEPTPDNTFVGSAASFTAAATGIPAPTVQWDVSTDGGAHWAPIAGATSPTYTFDPTLGQSGEEFEAVFTNVAGTATSAAAALTVTVPLSRPAITSQPTTQAVVLGSTATFSASASGNPTPTVQWQVSTDGGNTWGNVSGATSSTYTFTPTESESGYEYDAVFTNSQGPTVTSPASLIVGDDSPSTYNWSGYGATAADGTFTSVTGEWTVPTASCPSGSPSYSAEWIGIDGDIVSPSVEQDGTDSDCSGGVAKYYAWYEMYPLAVVDLSTAADPVLPGDSLSAAVSFSTGSSTWTLQIQDLTAGWTYSYTHVETGLDRASVEWIAERPELCSDQSCTQTTLSSLADFGSVTFTDATADGESISNPGLGATAIQMTNTGGTRLLALPGPLSGSGFTDTWYASS